MKLKEIYEPLDSLVVNNITEAELNQLLKKGIYRKIVGGEQWFRIYSNWFEMPSYVNPYKTPYDELRLLIEKKHDISRFTSRALKIFYGVGTGDTEIIPVIWDLETDKYSEVYVIEVIREFIDTFIQSLKNLGKEYRKSKVKFLGNNTMFEKLNSNDFIFDNVATGNRRVHICLGNTIGNFDQNEIFNIFSKHMKHDDYLIIGYQLRKNINRIIDQYKDNKRFEKLVRDSVKRIIHKGTFLRTALKWKINEDEDQIEAWIGDILAFRSKKYCRKKLEEFAVSFDLDSIDGYEYGDCGLSIFQKNSSNNNS